MLNILMVEDDKSLANVIKRFLKSCDINLDNTINGKALLNTLKSSQKYQLLILDLTLPDIDGLDLIDNIRKISNIPIIISSARDDILDKITGFNKGADDYLPKPYDPRELEARIKIVINRYEKKENISKNIFEINDNLHIIFFYQKELDLTLAQYDILELLIKRKNGIVSRDDIIYSSNNIDDYSSSKSIDVQISHIRKKLKEIYSIDYIQAVRGLGYTLAI
jgi:two-component system OmpR family response regulator